MYQKEAEQKAKQAEKESKNSNGNNRKSTHSSEKRDDSCFDSSEEQVKGLRRKALRLSSVLEVITPMNAPCTSGLYEDDIGTWCEWLQCSCPHWQHEDCVGHNEKICLSCTLLTSWVYIYICMIYILFQLLITSKKINTQ